MFEMDKLAEVSYPSSQRRHLSTTIDKTILSMREEKRLFIIQRELLNKKQINQDPQWQRTRKVYIMHNSKYETGQTRSISNKLTTTPRPSSDIDSIKQIRINTTNTLPFLIAFSLIAIIWSSLSVEAADIKANMPTVIVRGFLNYRTTVDGTVLLFTPDAGGTSSAGSQASSSSVFVAPSASSMINQQPTNTRLTDQIEPTSSFQAPAATMVPFDSANDAWRPVQATPPLRPTSTSQPAATATSATLETNDRAPWLMGAEAPARPEVVGTSSAHSRAFNEPRVDSSSTPSVQSDDIVGDDPMKMQHTTSTTTKPPVVDQVTRTSRPKRPSLGFNGQAIRAGGQRPDRPRSQTGNQNEAQAHNTINGIRRPGLSTTPIPATSETSDHQQPANPSGRSSLAGSKLRNRFKRPPTSGSQPSTPSSPAISTTTPSSFIQAIAPTTILPTSSSPVPNVSSSTLQSAESGDQPAASNSEQRHVVAAIATVEVAAEAVPVVAASQADLQKSAGSSELEPRMGDQAALQARLGDLFGPASSGNNQSPVSASPAVGSDEVLLSPPADGQQQLPDDRKLISRSGDQPPSPDMQHDSHVLSGGLSGELQQGQLGNAPLSLDAFFQGDQPQSDSSEHRAHHQVKESPSPTSMGGKKNHNERLTGWLDHHHSNKHLPRPPKHHQYEHEAGHLSQQLAANLNSLNPSFASSIPPNSLKPTPILQSAGHQSSSTLAHNNSTAANAHNATTANGHNNETMPLDSLPMQTLTQTYSTVMTSTRTRLVPLQVKSSTAVHTITENYVITKVLTAYQTMPVGEFILPEMHSTRSPFEMFGETPVAPTSEDKSRNGEQPISAPSNFVASPQQQLEMQEQPISFEPSAQKSSSDWLHDFNNMNNNNQQQQQQQQLQQNHLAALLEQQAQEQNLAGFGLGNEPLDQLASTLDPASLLTTNGQIQLPDLNNPIVLAAAIQNPQLAAVILAAQQLQLKQRAAAAATGNNKLAGPPTGANGQAGGQGQLQPIPAVVPLQPSYSTTFSTQVRPSTYTVRDTMFTTRLVSFKDGRTVRTRTVSEPGSVIEQVLTTTVTDTIPFTLTIRPTGLLTLPAGPLATAAPAQPQAAAASNQATISNALIATQLAQLLSRRQQQVQPSGLAALQQLLAAGQQQQPANLAALQNQLNQQRASTNNNNQQQQQLAKQFQPNFQNLLQSLQQQAASNVSPQTPNSSPDQQNQSQQQQQSRNNQPPTDKLSPPQPTPPLAPIPTQPYVTTITNLQVRTYTVHNAFQTHFRTITSTQLVTSTVFPPGMTRSPTLAG